MIRAAMDHLCGAADKEPAVNLDLASLVNSEVTDRQEVRQRVQHEASLS